MRNGTVHSSSIDHIYTNAAMKCSTPIVESIGDSDHLAVSVVKYTKEFIPKPQAVLKRNYKHFNLEEFLYDIQSSSINKDVLACNDIEKAAVTFERSFLEILNHHAPIKIFQTRKNYVPYLSEDTQ